jgi:small conductance mechanosensitive channel
MESFFDKALKSITQFWDDLGVHAADILFGVVKIVGIIIVAYVVIVLLRRLSRRILRARAQRRPESAAGRKADTIRTVIDSAIKYAVYFIAFMGILGVLGLGTAVASLLAAAGIGGIVIAFGAQSLVKDVFSGLFLLFEGQYAVGDYIEVDGEKGTVSAITLRTTSFKRFTGETVTIPNGSINKLVNYSVGDNLAVLDIPVSYNTDIEKASAIMQSKGLEFMASHDNILEEPHVLGIIELEESSIVLRMIIRVQPLTHWETERALRRMIVEEFARSHVEIPFPHRVVING